MEEQVGMMEHNEMYIKSLETVDDLYMDSVDANQLALKT